MPATLAYLKSRCGEPATADDAKDVVQQMKRKRPFITMRRVRRTLQIRTDGRAAPTQLLPFRG
jgi:hypothetical protein